MTTPLVLILLGTLCRVVPHPPNAVALGALALFAGAKLPRRWAWLVPIASMLLADLWLDWGKESAITVSRATIYGTYAAIALLLGPLAKRPRGPVAVPALGLLSLSASSLFFLTTNFAEWIAGPLRLYPITPSGLAACYAAAIPFFDNTIAADLAGVVVLFGLDALARRVAEGRRAKVVETAELADA